MRMGTRKQDYFQFFFFHDDASVLIYITRLLISSQIVGPSVK